MFVFVCAVYCTGRPVCTDCVWDPCCMAG